MLGRLGFAGRLSAILMLSLLAVWALAAGISTLTRIPLVPVPNALPFPRQVAAIVELLETSNADRRQTVLDAASSDTLHVSLAAAAPEVPPEVRRLKAVEWLVGSYVGALGTREVIVIINPADAAGLGAPGSETGWRVSPRRLRLAVALNSGGYALFETQGEISRRLLGVPPSFWLGGLGALVGLAALMAVWRESRPLKELALAVSRFSGDGRPTTVHERGAPELRRLIGEVNRMQERIATLVEGRTVLLGAVSHDLKTYITRLKLRAELISDSDQRTRAERDLDDMTALIEDALAVARGTSVHERKCLVDLAELLRAVCADRPGSEYLSPLSPVRIEGNPVSLRRLFSNVVDNALGYGGKHASVAVEQAATLSRVSIDDDGPGIPPHERELVFEPFYRRESSRSRQTGGSGLGLAIARQIAELHGGSIKLMNSPLGGLRVVVEIPLEGSRGLGRGFAVKF